MLDFRFGISDSRGVTIGETIRKQRRKLKLHQYQLAATIGVSQSTLSDWENGVQEPRSGRLSIIAKVLRISVSRLVA